MSMAHTTTLRAAGALMNIDLCKRDFLRFDFTRTGILAFINEVTGENYTEIEFVKRN